MFFTTISIVVFHKMLQVQLLLSCKKQWNPDNILLTTVGNNSVFNFFFRQMSCVCMKTLNRQWFKKLIYYQSQNETKLELWMIALPGTHLSVLPKEWFSSPHLLEGERNPELSQQMDIPDDTLIFITNIVVLICSIVFFLDIMYKGKWRPPINTS